MKNLDISVLLDFYGDMLTEKQREVIGFYYNEDLSLSEIGEFEGITRQGVRDSIKRGEGLLLEMEQRLGLARRFREMQEALTEIVQCAKDIDFYNTEYASSKEIAARADRIIKLARELDRE